MQAWERGRSVQCVEKPEGVSEKQKHFDPNRRYNGPLQKREKMEEETKVA